MNHIEQKMLESLEKLDGALDRTQKTQDQIMAVGDEMIREFASQRFAA